MQLPVVPDKLDLIVPGNNKVVEVIGIGEINLLRTRKLATLEINSFFPIDSTIPFIQTSSDFHTPDEYITFFSAIRNQKKPCRLIVTGINFLSMLVSIEKANFSVEGGEDDVSYNLSLKEYKEFTSRQVTLNPAVQLDNPAEVAVTISSTERDKAGFAVEDLVSVDGNYYYTSYGEPPYGIFNNYSGKIVHIVADTSRAYRYSIASSEGALMGWVALEQLTHR
ncbi:MAG: hypothetical protein PHE51_09665 [Eubacteriales bacterium]|nr:hypothetical protein [Eubacteriales bacterium]